MVTKMYERSKVSKKFPLFPEDFSGALRALLRMLSSDEIALVAKLRAQENCHFKASGTWEFLELVTSHRILRLTNEGSQSFL